MPDDKSYLFDMLNAARKIKQFTAGMTRDDFMASELHQNAVARLLQVIGEAARQVSDATIKANPQIEWSKIIGMRNLIVHRYFNIDLNIVWEVIEIHTDKLIRDIEQILPPETDS